MHAPYISTRAGRFAALLTLLALLAVFAWGCAAPKQVKSVELLSTPNLLQEADAAWHAREFAASELYYSKALERADLAANRLSLVYSRLAQSAYASGHFQQARIALEKWANLDAKALGKWDWERTYLDTLKGLGKDQRLHNHLEWMLRSTNLPWQTRRDVALWFSGYYLERVDYELALGVLEGFYRQAPDRADCGAFEQTFSKMLREYGDNDVENLAKAVTAENQWRFPYALVAFDKAARQAVDSDLWPRAWRRLRNIAAHAQLADRAALESALQTLEGRYGTPRVGLALALPLTGPYGKVGAEILRGAGLAQWTMAQEGIDLDVKVINTMAPGWEKRLSEMPSQYAVVGGPLRIDAFKGLLGATGHSVVGQRVFFTFLPSLGELQEGRDAWRFFSSRNDEVRSLVHLAVDQLGIKDLAVFYPKEKFGRTMAQTFYREALPLGGRIRGMEAYPSRDLPAWGRSIARLLDVPDDFSDNKDAPLPMPDFGAVFIPDGWNQAQNLLPNFFFYEGDQLLFLGPSLWSRALDRAKGIEEHYYRLAVCPGAWWPDSEGGRSLQRALTEEGLGHADFWVALGYDFIRFAGRFGTVPASWSPEDVNNRIASAQNMDFSMAPMTWDEQGVASQELFLFSPNRNGKELVNVERLTARIERAKERRAKRVEAYEQRLEEEKAKQEQSVFAPGL